jgi:two-component system, NtrC family, response regulator
VSSGDRSSGDLLSSIVDLVPNQLNLRELLSHLEKALIVRSLERSNGVQAEAARKLGLSRSDLGYKVGRYGISGPAESSAQSERS